MNEKAIQNALWSRLNLQRHSLVVPNYTPAKWWECDMFSLTQAGMMVEHEIKLTVADFRADGKKAKGFYDKRDLPEAKFEERWEVTQRSKHECLALADPNGPSRFFYVVPDGMVKVEEVPAWAGLLTFTPCPHGGIPRFSVERDAPKLHKQPCAESVRERALGCLYWRYWHLRTRLRTDDPRLTSEPKAKEEAA